jgi:hypothetical protein
LNPGHAAARLIYLGQGNDLQHWQIWQVNAPVLLVISFESTAAGPAPDSA